MPRCHRQSFIGLLYSEIKWGAGFLLRTVRHRASRVGTEGSTSFLTIGQKKVYLYLGVLRAANRVAVLELYIIRSALHLALAAKHEGEPCLAASDNSLDFSFKGVNHYPRTPPWTQTMSQSFQLHDCCTKWTGHANRGMDTKHPAPQTKAKSPRGNHRSSSPIVSPCPISSSHLSM